MNLTLISLSVLARLIHLLLYRVLFTSWQDCYTKTVYISCALSLSLSLLFVYFTRPSTSAAVVIVLFVPCHIQRHGVRWLLLCVWILSRQCVLCFFFRNKCAHIHWLCRFQMEKKTTTKRPIEIIIIFFLFLLSQNIITSPYFCWTTHRC